MRLILSVWLVGVVVGCAQPLAGVPVRVDDVRGVTIYRIDATLGRPVLPGLLASVLPAIKAARFNTVFLPAVWADYDPTPLANPRTYNAAAFASAKQVLGMLRAAHMRALVGLDYVGEGFAPDLGAVQPCDWAVNPVTYAAFEEYVRRFLEEMLPYRDVVMPFVFTEGAEGCGQNVAAAGPAVALRLQGTLGSLPSRLPAALRAAWSIGYHDYSLINLGWGGGVSPIASAQPFDWLSMVAYNVGTEGELAARLGRFRAMYPGVPMMIGELGASGCPPATAAQQAAQDGLGASFARQNGLGFSVWGWMNHGKDECLPGYGGLAITDAAGAPNTAAAAVEAVP